MIREIEILTGSSYYLPQKVNEKLKEGWHMLGEMVNYSNEKLAQKMVKYETEDYTIVEKRKPKTDFNSFNFARAEESRPTMDKRRFGKTEAVSQ